MATVSLDKNFKTKKVDKKRLEDFAKQEPQLIRVNKKIKDKS